MIDLELKQIQKSFDKTTVLNQLDLDIVKGELCCLLGPSGCGKTTLLKIINGLLEPDGGNVILAGDDITKLSCQKRQLGMVFQNYALFPHMNVFDNVAYGLHRRKVSKADIETRVATALGLVRLSGYEKRRIHELSGGQQQRVALARALVIEPRALLLDEPLSNLDARLRADMRDEIRRIQTELGITTVYVTHDQEEAMSIADRIVVMNNGVIEQIGSPTEIYESPSTAFVAAFVGNINFIPGSLDGNNLSMLGASMTVSDPTGLSGIITCAVRPERISLKNSSDSGITGTIQRIAYFGALIRYDVTVGDRTLMVQLPAADNRFDEGSNVSVVIRPDDIHLFPETGEIVTSL